LPGDREGHGTDAVSSPSSFLTIRDASQNRNFLLAEMKLTDPQVRQSSVSTFLAERTNKEIKLFNSLDITVDAPPAAAGQWDKKEIQALLEAYSLEETVGLSVLAVEMMPRYDRYVIFGPPPDESKRPLSTDLGQYRILRTSRLVASPAICCSECV
jgi:hypothetical protein